MVHILSSRARSEPSFLDRIFEKEKRLRVFAVDIGFKYFTKSQNQSYFFQSRFKKKGRYIYISAYKNTSVCVSVCSFCCFMLRCARYESTLSHDAL